MSRVRGRSRGVLLRVKLVFYHVCKWLGLFWLARVLTRRGLRIVGYHGFETADEGSFRQSIFMRPGTFARRLDWLQSRGYPVLQLAEAVERLERGDLPPCATVLTFDDGFASIWTQAMPLLRERGLSGTIYVTTYYCEKGTPIFRLALQYMFWKTTHTEVDLTGLGVGREGSVPVSRETVVLLRDHGESTLTEPERVALCGELGRRLDVDYQAVVDGRQFSVMTPDEVREAGGAGVDMQLHTHRHILPEDEAGATREVTDCRAVLEPLVKHGLDHFCYPTGIYSPAHFPILRGLGIRSATTCESGLNFPGVETMALHRFMDGDGITPIEFEADMSGFAHILRGIRNRLTGRKRA